MRRLSHRPSALSISLCVSDPLSRWQKNRDTSLSQSDKMPIVHVNNRDICQQNVGNPFRRYKKEEPHEVRKLDIDESTASAMVRAVWIKFNCDINELGGGFPESYDNVFELLKDIRCYAKDIERFSISLADFQDEEHFSEKAGIFLSAMINNSSDTDFIIYTKYLAEGTKEIRGIGYKNTKNITVDGNVGDDIGWGMSAGRILVKGDANEFVGWGISGGTIIIRGYVSSAGEHATGGKIVVQKGLFSIGEGMGSGCEIYSNGKYPPHLNRDSRGQVFHKGKLVLPETE